MSTKDERPIAVIENGNVYVLQAGTPVFLKTADVCSMTGKSNQWIGQLTSQGTINKTRTEYGSMYNAVDTISSYTKMLENRSENKSDKSAEIEEKKQHAEMSLKQSKAIVASLQAKELTGKMHRSEDVAAMTEDLVYTIRGSLLALPGRLAIEVKAAENEAEAAEIIRREVYKIMEELSEYKYDATKYAERVRERMKFDVATEDDE